MDNDNIRIRVRQMLESGALPCDDHGKVWAGRGVGTHCVACSEPIEPTEIEPPSRTEVPSSPSSPMITTPRSGVARL